MLCLEVRFSIYGKARDDQYNLGYSDGEMDGKVGICSLK